MVELLDNARDACSGITGAGVLATALESPDGRSVALTVTDTGRGMSASGAARLSGGVFISSKQDVKGQIGTYGVGLKGTVLWSLVAGAGALPAFGSLMLTSTPQDSDEAVTLRVRASHGEDVVFAIDVTASTRALGTERSGQGHTVVSLHAPCRAFAAFVRMLAAYSSACASVSPAVAVRIRATDSDGVQTLDASCIGGIEGEALTAAAIASAAGVGDAQVFSARLDRRGGLEVEAAVALQFEDTTGSGAAGGDDVLSTQDADMVAPTVDVSLIRLVNGAPLQGSAAGCAVAAAAGGDWWLRFGMRGRGQKPTEPSDGLFAPAVLQLEAAETRPQQLAASHAQSTAESPSLQASAVIPAMATPLASGGQPLFAFRGPLSSRLVGLRFVVSVRGALANSSTSSSCLKFGSLRKRSLLPHPRLHREVQGALSAAMEGAARQYRAMFRSAASRSAAYIFGGLLPSLSTSVCAVMGRMEPELLRRAVRALRLSDSDVSMADIRDEVEDRVARAAQTSVDRAGHSGGAKRARA